MIVIRHDSDKRNARRMSRHKATKTAKALNKHKSTITWGWNYRAVLAGPHCWVVVALDKRGSIFGYFTETVIAPAYGLKS